MSKENDVMAEGYAEGTVNGTTKIMARQTFKWMTYRISKGFKTNLI